MKTRILMLCAIFSISLFQWNLNAQEIDMDRMVEEAHHALQSLFDLEFSADQAEPMALESIPEWIERNIENAEDREMLMHDMEPFFARGAVALKINQVNFNCDRMPDMIYVRFPMGMDAPTDSGMKGYILHGLCGKNKPNWCKNCNGKRGDCNDTCICTKSTNRCQDCPDCPE